jgi:hypothetical protein
MSFTRLSVVTPPPVKPITLQDCYGQLRLDPSGSPPTHPDDAMLNRLISAATDYAEQATRRALVKQDVKLTYKRFPNDRYHFRAQETLWSEPGDYDMRPRHITLLRPNLLSVPSDGTLVQYYDQQNVLQKLDPTTYLLHVDTEPATIELLMGFFWPITYLREDAVVLNYTAGYAPVGSPPDYRANIPDGIKQGMLLHVQRQYDVMPVDRYKQMSDAIDDLIAPFKAHSF